MSEKIEWIKRVHSVLDHYKHEYGISFLRKCCAEIGFDSSSRINPCYQLKFYFYDNGMNIDEVKMFLESCKNKFWEGE